MKNIFLLLLLVSITATSQNNSSATKFYQLTEVDLDPTYKGCTQLNFEDCSSKKIIDLLQNSLDKEMFTTLQPEDAVVNIKLIISDIGKVERVMVQGKNKKLKEESLKILNNLEAFKPAIKDGKNVNTIVNLPIQLDLEIKDYDTPMLVADCVKTIDPIKCSSEFLQNLVLSNFDTMLFLRNKNEFSFILKFSVDENGVVKNQSETFDRKSMNKEIERILKLLPEFVPAIKNGEYVTQTYEMPIYGRSEKH